MTGWQPDDMGILSLPSGRLIRGRGLRRASCDLTTPDFGLYLLAEPPPPMVWESRWVRWSDFWLPSDRRDAEDAVREVWGRSESERVEIACDGGRGRTGVALACAAVLDGVAPAEAVAYVRRHYDRRAVETPWQRWYVRAFARAAAP